MLLPAALLGGLVGSSTAPGASEANEAAAAVAELRKAKENNEEAIIKLVVKGTELQEELKLKLADAEEALEEAKAKAKMMPLGIPASESSNAVTGLAGLVGGAAIAAAMLDNLGDSMTRA